MDKTIHFVSGLPRSGSTLLCNILLQNPKFHATQTSGCLDVLFATRNVWDNIIEHRAAPCPDKLQNVLKGILSAYYEEIDKPVIFDKSRGWIAYIELVEHIIGKKMKILVPVRQTPEILASFETLYRETAKVKKPPGEAQNFFQFQTMAGRCAYWTRPDQPVGLATNRLDDVIRRGLKDRLHFVHFNKLTSNPTQTMKEIYDFIGEEYFKHNFNHVEQVTKEDDDIYGFVNLHKIRNKVEPVKSKAKEILGEELVKQYS